MKSLEEMSLDEKISWACGTILLGIGEGKFRDSMASVLLSVNKEAYERGKAAGISEKKAKHKARKTG